MNTLRVDRLPGQTTWSPVPAAVIDFAAEFLEVHPAPNSTTISKSSLKSFVHRLVYRAKLTTNVLVVALVYLVRFSKYKEQTCSTPELCKELLFIVSVIAATKYIEDHPLTTFKIVNIMRERWDPTEVNEAERDFLRILQFQLWIDWSELQEFAKSHQLDCFVGFST